MRQQQTGVVRSPKSRGIAQSTQYRYVIFSKTQEDDHFSLGKISVSIADDQTISYTFSVLTSLQSMYAFTLRISYTAYHRICGCLGDTRLTLTQYLLCHMIFRRTTRFFLPISRNYYFYSLPFCRADISVSGTANFFPQDLVQC